MKSALLLSFSLLLTACTPRGEYPSLAKRPIEGQQTSAAPVAPAPPPQLTPIDAASLTRIRDAVQRGESSESDFNAALVPAESAVSAASGAAIGSEAWVAAQMAVSALERARAPLKTALADLDGETRLIYETKPNADLAELAAASARLAALDARHAALVEGLLARIRTR